MAEPSEAEREKARELWRECSAATRTENHWDRGHAIEAIAKAIAEARASAEGKALAEERERCAKIADGEAAKWSERAEGQRRLNLEVNMTIAMSVAQAFEYAAARIRGLL